MLSVIIFHLFLNINLASARVLATQGASQVPFFKSPESLFPSGYTTVENLQKQEVDRRMTSEKKIKWHNQFFNLDEVRPLFPAHLSQTIFERKTNQRFRVLETRTQSLDVISEDQKIHRSFNIEDVLADSSDMGFAITLKDAYLRQDHDLHSKILTTVPQATRFKILKFNEAFAQISYKNYTGFISLSEMITKFDMATMIYFEQKWHLIKKRDYDFIITNENKKVHLSQVKGLITPEMRGVIASAHQKIPLWSQVEVVNTSRPTWLRSRIKGHGHVWWRATEDTKYFLSPQNISIDELIRKEISSVSFHPKNPSKAILSAHGVYLTEDGLTWKSLKQFEDFNGPVYYFNDSLLFVGHYRSLDGGKTFENYIQIDKLTSAIEAQFGFLPKKLQIKKIETKAPYRLNIEIETGERNIKMESPLFSQDWQAVKTVKTF